MNDVFIYTLGKASCMHPTYPTFVSTLICQQRGNIINCKNEEMIDNLDLPMWPMWRTPTVG